MDFEDEIDPADLERKNAKQAKYWVPGVNGIVLEEALIELATSEQEMTLIVSKRKTGNKWHFGVTVTRGKKPT